MKFSVKISVGFEIIMRLVCVRLVMCGIIMYAVISMNFGLLLFFFILVLPV